MGLKSSKDRLEVPESFLVGFHVNRPLYFWIIVAITVLALLGNLLVIKTVIYRKYKYLQKTCIMSLAVSDILTIVQFSMINLNLLYRKPMLWIYGELLCHFIPVGQVWFNLTSSVALLVIALDRYHNVIHALSPKWSPALWKCLCGAFVICLICLGLSYPVVTFYIYIPILVNDMEAAICSGAPVTKSTIFLYYVCMICLFFLPIVLMFFWFYYKIAFLIWRHRKPPQQTDSNITPKKRNIQMEKKVRSFKIVVALIIAFIGCRLPYWLLLIFQQMNIIEKNLMWNLRFVAIILHLLNCVLNPLLYTFLNATLKACKVLSNICCCWCSNSDFDEFEKGKHVAEGLIGSKKIIEEHRRISEFSVAVIETPGKYKQREINY